LKVKKRTNKFIRILDVTDDSVRLDFYDNGTLDYDTLSVFFNNQLVQYKRLLDTKTPISFYVKVDSNEMNNDIIMFAEKSWKNSSQCSADGCYRFQRKI